MHRGRASGQADSFIRMLPGGYNTVLEGDGSGLSQGQRQLISIARAAVADPPALILDEATSSIDTRTEEVVQAGMDNLMKGRTVFVIAHRLSTVRNSDVIMVLDHGNIIERGSHDELIAQRASTTSCTPARWSWSSRYACKNRTSIIGLKQFSSGGWGAVFYVESRVLAQDCEYWR